MTDATRPTALITGATRGIGRAIAAALADTHRIVVLARDAAGGEDALRDLPDASLIVADLARPETLEGVIADSGIDRLDALILNAGILRHGTVADTPLTDWEESFAVNVFAPAMLVRALQPALAAAHGTVVMINSGSGFRSAPGNAVYSATKFALRALSDALREEVKPLGIGVASVHPGRTDTDMQGELVASEGGVYDASAYLTPERVAAAVVHALEARGQVSEISVRP